MKIKELILYSTKIEAQKKFYGDLLGLPILHANEKEISFKIGNSVLKFIKNIESKPYHFAINISSNKVLEALKWLKERVEIQKDGREEIVDFSAWNAESIYFYDAENNILEFIARKNLDIIKFGAFNSEDLLEISEIGLATCNFREKYDFLTSEVGVSQFGGGKEIFSALGSENGLFILIDIEQKNWFPTNDKAFAAEFQIKIELDGAFKTLHYTNETLSITQETAGKKPE